MIRCPVAWQVSSESFAYEIVHSSTQIATVEILREVKLPEPLFDLRLRSRDRFRCPFDAPAEDPPASEEAAAEIKGTRCN